MVDSPRERWDNIPMMDGDEPDTEMDRERPRVDEVSSSRSSNDDDDDDDDDYDDEDDEDNPPAVVDMAVWRSPIPEKPNRSESSIESLPDEPDWNGNDIPLLEPGNGDTKGISVNHSKPQPTKQPTPETPAKTNPGKKNRRVRYGYLDICLHLFSFVTYALDIFTDVSLAYGYYGLGDWWWFGLTLAFILVPSLVITAFSLVWYYKDRGHYRNTSKARWASRLLFHVLQLGPVIRCVDTVLYGCKSRPTKSNKNNPEADDEDEEDREHWYDLMLHENTDACMLRLIECFMEAAPQLVLQLYIMTRFGNKKNTVFFFQQVFSCVLSLFSLAWSLVAYHRAQRSRDKSIVRPVCGLNEEWLRMVGRMVLQFFWHMFIIAARVLSLALFASRFTFWVGIVCVVHFMIMLAWLQPQTTVFCMQGETQEGNRKRKQEKIQEFAFKVAMAGLYIFSDLDLPDGHTRLRYVFYYCIVYIENTVMILMWFFHTETTLLAVLVVVVVLVGFLIGVASQVTYYLYCHPNNFSPIQPDHPERRIQLRVSPDELVSIF